MTFVKAYIGETPLFEENTPVPALGLPLLKTGQTVSYATGDDGDIEAGRAVDFFTLASNNPFGNTNRFTALDGTQTYTNAVVIDWSTFNGSNVLGYYNGVIGNRTWPNAIAFANSLTIDSYSSWRLTNRNELLNLCLYEGSQFVFNYPPFSITTGTTYWTSTTVVINSENAYIVSSGSGISRDSGNKTDGTVARTIFCRTFTVTGTALT